MNDPFVHLHVASGYSLRHGASHPAQLVQRAADHGMDTLALTDRDGAYGAVKFAKACLSAGLRPVFGVDLAVRPVAEPPGRGPSRSPGRARASPARGGAFVEPETAPGVRGLPRVTLLARDARGWSALCRLISATHLAGERGQPVSSLELIAAHAGEVAQAGSLLALLGPGSELGRALATRRPDLAGDHLDRWRDVLGRDAVVIEVVSHRAEGEAVRAARMLGFAAERRAGAVLTNVVRYADRQDAPTADVLDAARRLVALDTRHVDRRNAEACLKSGKEMALVAEELARHAGLGDEGRGLLARTRAEAERCAVDPRRDLGIGEVHFPELEVVGEAQTILRQRCEAGFGRRGLARAPATLRRFEDELDVIQQLGYPAYFLTVADVVDLIKGMGVRAAARGSGAGSLVTYLLGISDVDPIRYGLLMERFLSPLRHQLPDIDLDVESARRTEVYEQVLARYGGERCTCVSMMDTYRARHGIRDVGAALGLPPGEVDGLAKAFPHIRANQVRAALHDLPELRASGLGKGDDAGRIDLLLRLVERLDGLPRHVALHPCGVLLSDRTLLDRTPVESSWLGFPMSQFDKDDVEELGLLKLDVLGIRMQSAMAYAVQEVERVDGATVDVDAIARDDRKTFDLIRSTRTLGCFQIESPGQRELVGKFAPETFDDLIIDISLFRPGPVKSDMIRPFLEARQGWRPASYPHPDLEECLGGTYGVVVFHEQVLQIVARMTGCTLAEADEVRRTLGTPDGQEEVRLWFCPTALSRGYAKEVVAEVWEVLKAFGSFGFCKAHAAAFALPTYQSAWLKAHHPAAFLAGVLTHDPGMYPKRLILDDARQLGIAVLSLDVNLSAAGYAVELVGRFDEPPPAILDQRVGEDLYAASAYGLPLGSRGDGTVPAGDATELTGPAELTGRAEEHGGPPRRRHPDQRVPDGRGYGIRIGLDDVKGINDAEVARILAGRPYSSLSDFWHRASVSRPVAERLVVAGGFDSLYGLGSTVPGRRRGQVTRRDLLLQTAELDRWSRSSAAAQRKVSRRSPARPGPAQGALVGLDDVRGRQARQSQAAAVPAPVDVQLALDLGDAPEQTAPSGLPEMNRAERVRAELEVLGLDVSAHVMDAYAPFLAELGTTRARDLLSCRSRQEVLVAGVKVATQTPPIRSGRRVVFVTLDDGTGPLDATLFEEAQVGYASTVFHSWLLVVRGLVRRTGPRGVSMQAVGCWELPVLHASYQAGGIEAVLAVMDGPAVVSELAVQGAAASRSTRPVMTNPPIVYSTGFQQSPYADIKPAGSSSSREVPRKLWHASPGSSGR
ncbi:MAG: polymerase alpha subunit [Frankiales bacterium]|nr:polymerase alpha subunit [Frankiales bacterium]